MMPESLPPKCQREAILDGLLPEIESDTFGGKEADRHFEKFGLVVFSVFFWLVEEVPN